MYLWPLLSLLGRLARSSCRKWPSNLYMQFFPFRKKKHMSTQISLCSNLQTESSVWCKQHQFITYACPAGHQNAILLTICPNPKKMCLILAMLLRWPSSCANSSLFQLSCGEEIKVHRLHVYWPIGLDSAQHHCSMPHVLKSQPTYFQVTMKSHVFTTTHEVTLIQKTMAQSAA